MKKIILPIALVVLQISFLNAQDWFRDMYDPSVNFFVVQQEFNDWFALNKQDILKAPQQSGIEGGDNELEGKWMLYKRWERQILPRMILSGGVRLGAFDTVSFNFNKQRIAGPVERGVDNTWNYIGPEEGFAPGSVAGCKGRINCIRFDPVDSNIFYVGAPSGGVWKSSDAGQSWKLLNTDTLAQIGVTDIVIDPNNNQHLFIATGDYANQASMSIGVLESTDGGTIWKTTGLTWTSSQGMVISRLLMNPVNTDIMIAASNNGIYKTTNAGVDWTKVSSLTQMSAMEFRPGNPNVIYACNTTFYESTNGGDSWAAVSTGLPGAGSLNALAIAVTPADTSCVYVFASSTTSSGNAGYYDLAGLYRSEDGGGSFTLRSVPPATAMTTQGVYDLIVGVSPVNRDVIVAAGVTQGYSFDGGLSFSYPDTVAHVDNHDVRFFPNSDSKVYLANDGGLFVSVDGGSDWAGLNTGLNIGQIYIIAPSARTSGLDLTGRQDDGTLLQVDSFEVSLAAGDGTNCAVDPSNDSIMYGSIEEGLFAKSVDYGYSYTFIAENWMVGVNGPGNWITPFLLNPQNHSSLYIGKDSIYKSVDAGASWFTLKSPGLGPGVYWSNIVVAPSDSNYIYASADRKFASSTNGGVSFTTIAISNQLSNIWSMVVSPTDPLKIWAASSYGVYYSSNGGHTFTNISTGLPPLTSYTPYSLAYLKNSPDAIYLGLHEGGGVYYTDSTIHGWIPFGTGLPNTSVDNLEISYAAGKIRAATYGRDLWETTLYNNWYNPPVAQFQHVHQTCIGQAVQFNNVSSFSPTSITWNFEGGDPSTSTDQNPSVNFASPGIYNISLTATNGYGSNTVTEQIVVSSCTGIEGTSLANAVALYPNPANSLIVAESDQFFVNKTVAGVYDITGRLLDVPLEYSTDKIILHIDNLAEGAYVLKLQAGENRASKMFVKTK